MNMAAHDFEWFLQHAEAYESLSVDQLHALGRGELVEYGETAPAPEPAAAESNDAPAVAAAAKTTEEPPVVLAKDGTHTIPFSELEAARARADELEALSKQQAELIENLKTAKAADAGTGDTAAQEDVLAEFKKQYPEIAETLAPALQKIIDAGVDQKLSAMRKELDATIQPLQKSAQDIQVDSHFQTITDAVPDFETLRDSGEVEKWIGSQPSFIKAAAERVLAEGTASEVIELFNQYKASLGKPAEPAGLTKEEIKARADEAVAKAKSSKPVSLTDVPSAQVQTHDKPPASVEEWSKVFEKMTPDQILKSL
jgi:hypothetical protein